MKHLILVSFLTFSTTAFSAQKTCRGTARGTDDVKGMSFDINITKNSVKITNLRGESTRYQEGDLNYMLLGSHRFDGEINGRDGKTYRQYHLNGPEGGEKMLVEEGMLKANASGLLKLRWRGEGFENTIWVCSKKR